MMGDQVPQICACIASLLPPEFSVCNFAFYAALAFYLTHFIWSRVAFVVRGSLKYHIATFLSDYLYLGEFGVDQLLRLDGNRCESIFEKRSNGLKYLRKVLEGGRDAVVPSKLTDCRFKKVKVLFPLLRELELPTPNLITRVEAHEVVLKDDTRRFHVGCDAVHYFDQAFYRALHRDVHKKMMENSCQFTFTTLTPEIVAHSEKITKLTNTDEVRYCLSGSEAVEIALKDVKVSTGKPLIVRFKNAYHGHLSGVANDAPNQVYLRAMDEDSLEFIEKYHYKIAAVIVNPMEVLSGPNQVSPPGEKLTAGKRLKSRASHADYAAWLHKLNAKCKYVTEYLTPVAFCLDDVYFAFRTSSLFSKDFFKDASGNPLDPDVLILGKGVAGGFPLALVCGKSPYMNRYDRSLVLKVNRSVGTFSAWEGGVVASSLFLDRCLENRAKFDEINAKFDRFTAALNARFTEHALPLRMVSFANTFTVDYVLDSLYNSMYPQFLMAEGVYFSNQSTGKFNLSDDYSEGALHELAAKFVAAGLKMRDYGFFEPKASRIWYFPVLRSFGFHFLRLCYDQIMLDKKIDIDVSHNHPFNRFGHFWSSIGMIFIAYPASFFRFWVFVSFTFLATHTLRQAGHFFYERQDRDAEKKKFGHKDRSKKEAVPGIAIALLAFYFFQDINLAKYVSVDQMVVCACFLTILPHFAEIWHKFGFLRGVQWLVKIITDPFTDVIDFWPYKTIPLRYFVDFNFLPKYRNPIEAMG